MIMIINGWVEGKIHMKPMFDWIILDFDSLPIGGMQP